MYYSRLNAKGKEFALRFAKENGLTGNVVIEYTPSGERCAFFKLSKPALGDTDVNKACKAMELCGFDPDVLFMGYPVQVNGGFIGKSFSDKATTAAAQI